MNFFADSQNGFSVVGARAVLSFLFIGFIYSSFFFKLFPGIVKAHNIKKYL